MAKRRLFNDYFNGHVIRNNNKKETPGRRVYLVPKYTNQEIMEAPTTIEKYRRARCFKNIKVTW